VKSDVVNVGADGVGKASTALRLLSVPGSELWAYKTCLSEVLLLVQDKVLGASHDARGLHTLNSLSNSNTGEHWVWTEAWRHGQ